MAYAVGVKRLDPKTRRAIYVKKSRATSQILIAESMLKTYQRKHPNEEVKIIEI